eukprot:COSAG01_NODE_19762_length_990_cov_7.897868_1_plen_138_part_00
MHHLRLYLARRRHLHRKLEAASPPAGDWGTDQHGPRPPQLHHTMTTIRRFGTDDMFRFNAINLDHLTETYNLNFYLQYLAKWPEFFLVNEAPTGRLTSYGAPPHPPFAEIRTILCVVCGGPDDSARLHAPCRSDGES